MIAAVCAWKTDRIECYTASGGIPDLIVRGTRDGVGDDHTAIHCRKELGVYEHYCSTPVIQFLHDLRRRLGG